MEIANRINEINWANFETAYGNAANTIPHYLENLFSSNKAIAKKATHDLWCSLCHQHAYISSASLPSYDILKIGLLNFDTELQTEILDIFQGFSECTKKEYYESLNVTPRNWEVDLRQKLIFDIPVFQNFIDSSDEVISNFATIICENLVE